MCQGDEAALQMLLNDGDFCHDGKVSRDEFVHMMKMPEHKRMLTTAAASKDQDDLENMARCYLRQEVDPNTKYGNPLRDGYPS